MKKELKNPKKADLNKDGQLSGYEKKRGMAIEEAMGVKMGSLIMASNGELIPYREFKKKKLEQNFEQGKKDPLGKSLKNKPPAKVVDKNVLQQKKLQRAGQNFQKATQDLKRYVEEVANPRLERDREAFKKAVAEYPEKRKQYERMVRRIAKEDDLAVRKAFRAVGRTVPFVSKALGVVGSLIPTKLGSAELKDMEKKKYGGSVGVKMAKGGFKKKTPIY